jgi:hypothetical protein
MKGDTRVNAALSAFFASEYDQEWTTLARYTLLDEQTEGRELVTAELSTNGNEFAVRAWTYVRSERELERDTVRLVPGSAVLDGDQLTFGMRVDLGDIQEPSAVPISETLFRMILAQYRRECAGDAAIVLDESGGCGE